MGTSDHQTAASGTHDEPQSSQIPPITQLRLFPLLEERSPEPRVRPSRTQKPQLTEESVLNRCVSLRAGRHLGGDEVDRVDGLLEQVGEILDLHDAGREDATKCPERLSLPGLGAILEQSLIGGHEDRRRPSRTE